MLLAPRSICCATRAMLRSRSIAVAHRSEEREGPRPVHPGYDVAAPLLACLEPLAHDLDGGPCRSCGRSRPDGATNRATARRVSVDPRLELHPAHRHHARGASPENRLETETPSSASRPAPVAGALLDDGGVGRPVGDEDPAELAVVPPERRDAGAGAVQDALLAGRRRARRAGRSTPRSRWLPAVHPAAQRRHRPGLQGPLRDREGDPVELHEDDAVDLRVGDLCPPGAVAAQRRR